MYAVVKFLGEEDDLYSEVPSTWISYDKKKCSWPPNKSKAYIEKYFDPLPNWVKYPIHVDGFFDTLEEARKAAANLESTDEENKGRGKRVQSKPIHYSPPERDAKQLKKKTPKPKFCITPPPTPPPSLKAKPINVMHVAPEDEIVENYQSLSFGIGDCTSNLLDAEFNINDVPVDIINNDIPIQIVDGPIETINNDQIEIMEDNRARLEEIKLLINNMRSSLSLQLQDVVERLDNIEKSVKEQIVNDPENFDIYKKLPLKSIPEIKEIEHLLNDENMHRLKLILRQIGGIGVKDNVTRILKKIFSDECAEKCSWLGHRNNFKIENLKIVHVIFDSVNFKNKCDLKNFEIMVKDWLRHAKQRRERTDKKNEP